MTEGFRAQETGLQGSLLQKVLFELGVKRPEGLGVPGKGLPPGLSLGLRPAWEL